MPLCLFYQNLKTKSEKGTQGVITEITFIVRPDAYVHVATLCMIEITKEIWLKLF